MHNIIRAFSINDPKYINRIILETREVYLPAFEKMEELRPVRDLFYDLSLELEEYYIKIQK
jgi:hypothetical protein